MSDRNLRRLALLTDGRIAAGSAPKGNIYLFAAAGGAPYIAQENHDAEVTDLLAGPDGGYFAAIVYSGGEIHPVQPNVVVTTGPEGVVIVGGGPTPNPAPGPAPVPNPGPKPKDNSAEILNSAGPAERFPGRSTIQSFSPEGFPETLASRSGVAFYRMCRMGDLLVISGGELGEMSGYDLKDRLSLTFSGSISSQVNALAAVPGKPGRFFAIRNNAPGFALLDFDASTPRTVETKRVDLGTPGRLGALWFNRVRNVDAGQLSISVRTTNGAAETDGWSPWVPMADNDGWRASVPAGRYAQLKLTLAAATAPTLELDKASFYFIGQNHRPQLQEFRTLSPNFAIVVPPEMPPAVVTTVGQLMQGDRRRKDATAGPTFQGACVVASPGTRVELM